MRKTGKGVVSINPNIIDGFFIEHFLEYKTEPLGLISLSQGFFLIILPVFYSFDYGTSFMTRP
jgi:hypothetical protein